MTPPDKRAHVRGRKESISDGGYGSNVIARSAPLVAKCDTTTNEGGREQEPLTDIGGAERDKHDPTQKHSNVSSGHSLQHVQP